MNEMLERVAAAIDEEIRNDDCREYVARAAIAAMREPTPGMIAELRKLEPFFRDADRIWTALIDMALNSDE